MFVINVDWLRDYEPQAILDKVHIVHIETDLCKVSPSMTSDPSPSFSASRTVWLRQTANRDSTRLIVCELSMGAVHLEVQVGSVEWNISQFRITLNNNTEDIFNHLGKWDELHEIPSLHFWIILICLFVLFMKYLSDWKCSTAMLFLLL